jgi:alpha-1,6-mannosyltransferase
VILIIISNDSNEFAGALSVALLSVPFRGKNLVHHIPGLVWNSAAAEKLYILIGARCILACLVWSGLVFFVRKSSSGMNRHVSSVFFALTCLQFHAPFYMSRMLPNTFALALTSIALGWWNEGKKPFLTIWTMTFAAIVFRCDAIILVGMVGIHMLWSRQVGTVRGLCYGACAVVCSLMVSVLVDSYFWQRWLWPEGEVLWFNTALNKYGFCIVLHWIM